MKSSNVIIKWACTALFLVFTYCYLRFYQCDLLAIIQDVLSQGQTTYHPIIGAILLTIVFFLLCLSIQLLFKPHPHLHALTYFPSLLLLAQLLDVDKNCMNPFIHWHYVTLTLLIIVVMGWILLAIATTRMAKLKPVNTAWLRPERVLWCNMLIMSVMFLMVIFVGNNSKSLHQQARIEYLLKHGDAEAALKVVYGSRNGHSMSDTTLTMLRCHALALTGKLGDELFHYDVCGGSEALLPRINEKLTWIYPQSEIYKTIGAYDKHDDSAIIRLKRICRYFPDKNVATDYLLTAYLLDRQLPQFASLLSKSHYTADTLRNLPQHYAEALMLYKHKYDDPKIIVNEPVVATNYDDFMAIADSISDNHSRQYQLYKGFRNTYWYYFYK